MQNNNEENNYEKLLKKFTQTILITNRDYNFYINWNNVKDYENYLVEINIMNQLIKNNNFDNKFREILLKHPNILKIFPLLIAICKNDRNEYISGKDNLRVLIDQYNEIEQYNFNAQGILSENDIEKYLIFFQKFGLKNLFQNILTGSLQDYIVGILVGLDSNGRKNRSGKNFELMCFEIINKISKKHNIKLFEQKRIKDFNNISISNWKADFILKKDNKIVDVEVNYYYGNGSKPEEIINSYIERKQELNKGNIDLILITDGNCWNNPDKNQLIKGIINLNMMNYNMLKNGYFEEKISEIFKLNNNK